MSTAERRRLDGLDSGNLLAFLALLGLLRSLEEAEPSWLPRVAWAVEAPPVRPLLTLGPDGREGRNRSCRGGRPEPAGGTA